MEKRLSRSISGSSGLALRSCHLLLSKYFRAASALCSPSSEVMAFWASHSANASPACGIGRGGDDEELEEELEEQLEDEEKLEEELEEEDEEDEEEEATSV